MKRLLLFLFVIILVVGTASAASDTFDINWIVPDDNPPTFDNLRNFTQFVNNSFSQSITASDDIGIDAYILNDTSSFNVNRNTGLITNVTPLITEAIYWLTITVNDTSGNEANGEFFINITIEVDSGRNLQRWRNRITNEDVATLNNTGSLWLKGNLSVEEDVDMNNGSIRNIGELKAPDGSAIAFGNNPIYNNFSGLDKAIVISTNQSLAAGEITHAFLDTFNNRVMAAWQSGKNDSGQYTRNSAGYFPDLGLTNLSILTNMEEMWSRFGINPLADYFSEENKTSLAVLWAVESQKLYLHDDIGNGELYGLGEFTWIAREGTDIDLYGGDGVHIKNDVIKEFGFNIGDNITSLNANFNEGSLSPFVQTTGGGLNDWSISLSASCHHDECARAGGGSGSPLRSMETNFSSLNQDNLNLSFWVTAVQASPDVFTVIANNNEGSGDVTVFTSSATLTDEFRNITLPSSMDNRSVVTLTFNYQGNNPISDEVFVDEILVIGNATTSTLANVTVEDANIELGDGTCGIKLSVEDGYKDLNITCDHINLIGNVTAINVVEVSINVTDSITAGGNITAEDRFVLGNSASIGYNATCAFIFYNQTGSIVSALGCV
jgi:hypothetical protein